MRIRATPRQAEVILRRRAAAVDRAIRQSEKETLKDALRIAQRMSSGPYSLAMLARMGHPYARRNPRPPGDPALINVQSGVFRASWTTRGPFNSRSGLISRLVNTAAQAVFLALGTVRMIPRPIAAAIMRRVRATRYRRLQDAVARAVIQGD